jgi:hypothetical protein
MLKLRCCSVGVACYDGARQAVSLGTTHLPCGPDRCSSYPSSLLEEEPSHLTVPNLTIICGATARADTSIWSRVQQKERV